MEDSAAKSALDLLRCKVGVTYINFKHHISQYILFTSQDHWNDTVLNTFHSAKPVLEDGSRLIGGEGGMTSSCNVPALVTHI